MNIHALGRDPPCPCHTATPKRYLLSARVTTASSASFCENIIQIRPQFEQRQRINKYMGPPFRIEKPLEKPKHPKSIEKEKLEKMPSHPKGKTKNAKTLKLLEKPFPQTSVRAKTLRRHHGRSVPDILTCAPAALHVRAG